jgi:hypothetical protein
VATALTERLQAAKVTAAPIKEVTAKIKASLLRTIVVAAALRIAQGAIAAKVTVVMIAPAKIAIASAARRKTRALRLALLKWVSAPAVRTRTVRPCLRARCTTTE